MITVRNLRKTYGRFTALDGVSFDVPPGEIFGFVGPNGAGKTTSMRVMTGLVAPTAGDVSVDGIDVVRNPAEVRERVGYMPDFFGVYDHLSTAEYLAFYASCYRVPSSRIGRVIDDLLDLIQLTDKRDTPVDALSRGMKQRLCLARCLVHDPPVLLLDEPASGLDPRARVEMRELLRELQAMGKTIVISSHILPELAELCTVFGIIDRGRMVSSGTLDGLTGAAHRLRARVQFLAPLERTDEIVAIPGVAACEVTDDTAVIEYEGGDETAVAILAGLVAAGLRVVSFSPMETDLEDLFLRLTGEPT